MAHRFFTGFSIARHSLLAAGLSAVLGAGWSQAAHAGAVIFNSPVSTSATVALGVNDLGHLNFNSPSFQPTNAGATGLSSLFPDGTWRDATAPGCLCEGWGLAATASALRISGYANEASGTLGLSLDSFSSTATTASSNVFLTSLAGVKITHDYSVSSASTRVFKGKVTITNDSSDVISDIVYRRVMDWDVPPTEFNEFVSHYGVEGNLESASGNVRFASDNGFASSDPTTAAGSISSSVNTDFVDLGPADHGSVFDFAFGDLAVGDSRTFDIFYGAFPDETAVDAALPSLELNLWSLGQSNSGGAANNDGTTYLFGFRGVGSFVPIPPASVPGPLPLLGIGAGFGWSRILRRRIKAAKSGALVV